MIGDPILRVIVGTEPDNSLAEMQSRAAGFHICQEAQVTGTGANTVNLLQLTGTVRVLNQWAIITEVTTLNNLTGVYATAWDGTNTIDLTADGAVLSGMPSGTVFTKDKLSTETYSVNDASTVSILETIEDRKAGRPFTITQKNGADTFLQLNFTTTDNPVDFAVEVHFEYEPMNGGTLEFVGA
jgi:hypothetical protein